MRKKPSASNAAAVASGLFQYPAMTIVPRRHTSLTSSTAQSAPSGPTTRTSSCGTGTPTVLVTSALASGLRGLARLSSAPRGMRDNELAKEVGVPPWKLRSLRAQARGWEPEALGRAIRVVARADADIKGQATDAAYALERAVLEITRTRGS